MSWQSAGDEAAPAGGVALDLPVTAAAVEQVRLAVSDYLAEFGLTAGVMNRVEVVLEELISNVVRHASGATGLSVGALCRGGTMRISIEDDGPAFDPLAQPEPAPYTTLEDAVPGGLGIPLIKRLAHGVAYCRANGRNQLCVTINVDRK